jgi:hypothetical protein
MEQDNTILNGSNLPLSGVRSYVDAKDIGMVGIALFMCLMVACALFFN